MCLPTTTKETLSNLYEIRRHCLNSIQEAEARGRRAEAQKYRDEFGRLNSLIKGMGVHNDSWVRDQEEAHR